MNHIVRQRRWIVTAFVCPKTKPLQDIAQDLGLNLDENGLLWDKQGRYITTVSAGRRGHREWLFVLTNEEYLLIERARQHGYTQLSSGSVSR